MPNVHKVLSSGDFDNVERTRLILVSPLPYLPRRHGCGCRAWRRRRIDRGGCSHDRGCGHAGDPTRCLRTGLRARALSSKPTSRPRRCRGERRGTCACRACGGGDSTVIEVAVPLSPQNRAEALRRMAEEQFDVLVIGAGVVGAGAALDAASRGLTVGLVEARDFAAGTSSRSSKLVHGGLRYLKQLNFSPGLRGAARAVADPRHAVPAPGPAGRVHLPAGEAGHRTGGTSASASGSTTCSAPGRACRATTSTCRRRRR